MQENSLDLKQDEELLDTRRDDEIIAFIGIPRKWVNPAIKIFSFIFAIYAGFAAAYDFRQSGPLMGNSKEFFVHIAAFGAGASIMLVAIYNGWDVLMYLTTRFKASLQQRVKKARTAGMAAGKAEGIAENQRAWLAWNNRRLDAEAKGLAFDEPPPNGTNGDAQHRQ